ncbi:hypothetical protein D3C80_586390 [compost metagenome]
MAPREPERTQARRFNFYVALNVTALWAFTKGQAGKCHWKIHKTTNEFNKAHMIKGFRCSRKPLTSEYQLFWRVLDIVTMRRVDRGHELLRAFARRIDEDVMRTASLDNVARLQKNDILGDLGSKT